MAVETAIVSANCRKNWPVMPLMNAVGMNTAASTSATAMTAPPTSLIVCRAASRADKPRLSLSSMASTTTMASSTTIPMASTSPKSEIVLRENPNSAMAAKVPMSETSTAASGMIVARQLWRKRSTTRVTRKTASRSVRPTAWIDSSTKIVVS